MKMSNDNIFKLHRKDVRELSKVVPNETVTTTITSPPYADLKDYGYEEQIGYGDSYEKYLGDLENVFQQVYNATKPDGTLWIIVDTFKRNGNIKTLPFDIANRLKENIGWYFQDIAIWNKGKTLPWSNKGRLRNTFEYILFFTKSRNNFKYFIDRIKEPNDLEKWWVRYPERYNPKGKVPDNIWNFTIPTQGSWSNSGIDHFNPFPPALMERIILLSTQKDDVVMDPFAGTGTALAQADVMDRMYIGFELNEEYVKMFHESVKDEVRERWEERKEKIPEREQSQIFLKQQIEKLRRLKFPKTMVRRLILDKDWSEDKLELNTIFVLKKDKSAKNIEGEHKFMEIDLILVTNDGFNQEKLKKDIKDLVSQPPLSKFGIKPNIHIHNRENFAKDQSEFLEGKSLWLYTNGRFYKFKASYDIEKWGKATSKNVNQKKERKRIH